MPSLSFFTSSSLPTQSTDKAYGVKTADLFRVSSSFDVVSEIPAFAMIDGTILLQQQHADLNKVNLILRPHDQKDLKLPIKYVIYRGLKTTDFIDSTNLSDTNNKVKTSGNELLVKMQVIQNQRAPGTEIPVEALFGNELSPVSSKNIDEFFFKNLAANSQLFTIDCGIELGKFAVGEIGIEIILENPEYFVTVEIAKKNKYEINVSGITDAAQKKWQKDLVRHFVDLAAFYGLHYDIKDGIEYRQGANKLIANTPALVYQNIIDKFFTKNKVYLDIRNENGYSYNYYGNYVGTGTDSYKELKIGQTAAGMLSKEYYTNGWAIHIVDVAAGSGTENEIFLALRVNDNEKPLLAGWNVNLIPNTVVDPPLSNPTSNRIYFTDETLLLPTTPSSEFTNTVSFKVPNITGTLPSQMTTIVRLDYNKRKLDLAFKTLSLTSTTDFYFGTTNLNIPWDTNDSVLWYTDNFKKFIDASSDIGFAGYLETGHIFDTNPDDPSNVNILVYATPERYLLNQGFEKQLSFNKEGGSADLGSFINLVPDVSFERTNLMLSLSENILSFSLALKGKLKKPIQFLGLTKTEWDTVINGAASFLSDNHLKMIKLNNSGASKTDLNGTDYNDFEIVIAGMDNTGVVEEVATGLTVYTLDNLFFNSKDFSNNYQIDYTVAENNLNEFINETLGINGGTGDGIKLNKLNCSQEEIVNLENERYWTLYTGGKSNRDLFALDSTMKTKVTEFKTALDNVSNDYNSLETILKSKGAELLHYGKQQIKSNNKDGILYLTRLIMQVILKNHPKLLSKFPSKIKQLSDIFEKHSRGFAGSEKPVFDENGTSTHFNILISGYDPFAAAMGGGYYDSDGFQSNPSGNLALALDGEKIISQGKNATVKAIIVPVRFKEFDDGWIEEFFTPYITDDNVKMIITFSYGIDGTKYSMEIERFAARHRGIGVPDNNLVPAPESAYLDDVSKNDEYIQTTLPFNSMFISNEVGLDQKAIFHYYKNNELIRQGYDPAIDATQISPINDYKFYPKNPHGNDDLRPDILVPDINITNYPPPSSINVNKLKSYKGPGGYYLSNEIFYRVAYLRKKYNGSKLTGHIHVGYLQNDNSMSVDRSHMLQIIKESIKQAINNF